MNFNYFSIIKEENQDYIHDLKSNIDEYLCDSNFSVSAMIEKYDVSNERDEKKSERKNLRCTVCTAKAFGYNFDQITCESCKAFFRRNALKNLIDIHCRYDGTCIIALENRRHCTHCRIKKCFAVGMRKEWIRSEEEKTIKRVQLEKNRKIKRTRRSLQMVILRSPGHLNSFTRLSSLDRIRLNNITLCYDQYTGEPSIFKYSPPKELLLLRLHDFFNRKKPIIINFISFFKHLPEFHQINVDDQVLLIKQNIHLLLPLNYSLLKTPVNSQFRYTYIQTIGCFNNINLHTMYQVLSNSFVQFVTYDPMIIKLFLITLFFTTNLQPTNFDFIQYEQLDNIKRIQYSYTELLWLYMTEKCGEINAIHLFSKMITKYLYLQTVMNQIDSIIRLNNDIQYLDSLMKTILQLN